MPIINLRMLVTKKEVSPNAIYELLIRGRLFGLIDKCLRTETETIRKIIVRAELYKRLSSKTGKGEQGGGDTHKQT